MRTKKLVPLFAIGLIAVSIAAVRQTAVTAEVAIARSVEANMPVDTASNFAADVGTVVCWTRITGATAGSKITHVWIHGADTSNVDLNIGGSPWRTYSRKTIGAGGSGEWTVQIKDDQGTTIATRTFTIG
jgi:hypothetical protein